MEASYHLVSLDKLLMVAYNIWHLGGNLMSSKIKASMAGWNASARACRENAVKFYYSYLGYKADVGEMEVVEYVREHRQEAINHIETFIHRPSPNQHKFPRAAARLAKAPKAKLKQGRLKAIAKG